MKLLIMNFGVINSEGIKDNTLLDDVKKHIKTSEKLYNPVYTDLKTSDRYFFIGPAEKDDFFYFSTIKKETKIGVRKVNNETTRISKDVADTEDFARFGIDFRNNLICCILKGHFGKKQFKESLKYIISSALDMSGFDLYIEPVSSQPASFNFDSITEIMRSLNLRNIELNISFPIDENLNSFSGLSERFILENKLNYSLNNIESITQKIDKYRDENCYINLKIQDLTGHPMTLSKTPMLGLAFDIDENKEEMAFFTGAAKDAIDDYLRIYW